MKIQNVADAEKKKKRKKKLSKNYCDKSKHFKLLVINSLVIKNKEQSKPPQHLFLQNWHY